MQLHDDNYWQDRFEMLKKKVQRQRVQISEFGEKQRLGRKKDVDVSLLSLTFLECDIKKCFATRRVVENRHDLVILCKPLAREAGAVVLEI